MNLGGATHFRTRCPTILLLCRSRCQSAPMCQASSLSCTAAVLHEHDTNAEPKTYGTTFLFASRHTRHPTDFWLSSQPSCPPQAASTESFCACCTSSHTVRRSISSNSSGKYPLTMRSPSVAPRISSTTARPSEASHARKPQPCARTWRPTPSGLSALLLPSGKNKGI